MKRFRLRSLPVGLIPWLLMLPVFVAACGQTQGGPRGGTGSTGSIPSKVVFIDANGFQESSVTIAAGHGLDFVNMPQSPARDVCLGQHSVCNAKAAGPQALRKGGMLLHNSESYTVAFNTPGTYRITTTPMPVHDLTVIVT